MASNHPWERAGLGAYPYRVVGVAEKRGPITYVENGVQVSIGSPGQPMGVCDYCGQGIAECWHIKSADGKQFVVGCDCVRKAYKEAGIAVPSDVVLQERKIRAAKAKAKDNGVKERIDAILADPPAALLAAKVKTPWGEERSAYDDFARVIKFCGAAGRARHLKRIEKLIAESEVKS